jgi:putative membrane protein
MQMDRVRLVGTLAFVLLVPSIALGQERAAEWQWGMHPMMFMWGAGGLVMMLMMLVFWGLLIAGLVFGVRWLAGQGRGAPRDEALEILRQGSGGGVSAWEVFASRGRDLGI